MKKEDGPNSSADLDPLEQLKRLASPYVPKRQFKKRPMDEEGKVVPEPGRQFTKTFMAIVREGFEMPPRWTLVYDGRSEIIITVSTHDRPEPRDVLTLALGPYVNWKRLSVDVSSLLQAMSDCQTELGIVNPLLNADASTFLCGSRESQVVFGLSGPNAVVFWERRKCKPLSKRMGSFDFRSNAELSSFLAFLRYVFLDGAAEGPGFENRAREHRYSILYDCRRKGL